MSGHTSKPHPTPGVWRTRVQRSRRYPGWEYRMYLSKGGVVEGFGYATEADARRGLARCYFDMFGVTCDHLNHRADYDWPATGHSTETPR